VDHLGTSADLNPGDVLELRWTVINATAVQISALPVNGQPRTAWAARLRRTRRIQQTT
jgi:hypothetical protein